MRMNTNGKKVVRALTIGIATMMAAMPVTVYAEEFDNNSNVSETPEATPQSEVNEAANNVTESVSDNNDVSTSQESIAKVVENKNTAIKAEFTATEEVNNDISSMDTKVAQQIASIVADDAVVNDVVDSVDKIEAVNGVADVMITELQNVVEEGIKDQATAESVAQAALSIADAYEAQAELALKKLKSIDGVELIEDGDNVYINWDAAEEEIKDLYKQYLAAKEGASEAEETATAAMESFEEKEKAAKEAAKEATKYRENPSGKVVETALEESKDKIDELIAKYAKESVGIELKRDFAYQSGKINASESGWKWYVNKVETTDSQRTVYGCLTYYDAANNVILRKYFSFTDENVTNKDNSKLNSDSTIVNTSFTPPAEEVKVNQKTNTYGNSGNYVGASLATYNNGIKDLLDSKSYFNGVNISNLLEANYSLSEKILDALATEKESEAAGVKAQNAKEAWENAEKSLEDAYNAYLEAVQKYANAAAYEKKVYAANVEKAKYEYIAAAADEWGKKLLLDAVDNAINGTANFENTSHIDTLVENVAATLGIKDTETVEEIIVDSLAQYAAPAPVANVATVANVITEAPETGVAGVRVDKKEMDTNDDEKAAEKVVDKKDTVVLEDDATPLAETPIEKAEMSLWWLIVVALLGAKGYEMYKEHEEKKKA